MLDGRIDDSRILMASLPREAEWYLPTEVTVQVDGQWISAFELAGRVAETLHIVTAWDPGDLRLSREVNQSRNIELRADIEAMGSSVLSALGSDPNSEHSEESWAVFGLTDEQAIALGAKFDQVAVFQITGSRQTVLGCVGEWKVSRGSRVPIGIADIAHWINEPARRSHLQKLLDRYFVSPGYEGRQFEWFVSRSQPDRFTGEDLAAIGSLSVSIRASTARKLLEDPTGILRARLFDCRVEASLHRQSPGLSWLWQEESAFNALFKALNKVEFPGVGTVVRSKLMATKFPSLIPIRDSRVESLLDCAEKFEWWEPLHGVLTATESTLSQLNATVDGAEVTALRKLDVILWMEATDRDL